MRNNKLVEKIEKKTNNVFPVILMGKYDLNVLEIEYNFYETRFGKSLVACTNKGVCFLAFGEKEEMLKELKQRFPKAVLSEIENTFHQKAIKSVQGEKISALPLHLYGTDFQLKVWKALLQIPSGKLATYKTLAQFIGNPQAMRAVGTAVGANPVSYVIPCHRIVRTDGGLGGYHWGLNFKKQMIEKEE